ncbi:restriction endonuclease subunit S, partial [Patescibacteria group bacterium]|nr:restriction endonuclease subunit S [Patescibacteria group bacterium]
IFIDEGKSCLNGRNIKNNRVDIENSNYVSEKEFEKFNNFKVKENDILITLKGLGSIGKTGLVFSDTDSIFSRNIGLIRLASQQWARYVYAFLLSKYGEKQIERSISGGTGQVTLATSYLKRLKIHQPNSMQVKFVSDIIKWSEEEYKKSYELYSEAENLLLEELELKDFQSREDLSFVVNYSDIKKANRIDADYFQPKYADLIKNLKKGKTKFLPRIIENTPAIFNPKPDDSYKYVELSNINSSIGIIDGYSEVLGKEAPSRAKRMLKQGDLIVSSVEGSLGKVALVNKEQEGYLASTGFFQFRSKEILSEVLLVLSKCYILKMQLQKETAGTILTAVSKKAIKNILIPVVSKPIQQKISNLVKKSHEARKKSKELLEEAKRKVEEMIERR